MERKTKKLINNADNVIDELIDGMVGAHPNILCVQGPTGRAIVAKHGPRSGKVGIVIGGGSGHEPAFSGYVGKGLADAAAVGNVFASPSPVQILDAARSANGGTGVLFLYGNYTGDVMNFDMAAEAMVNEGVTARSVTVTDDVASAEKSKVVERRGIAGTFFVFKCAGAAADLNHTMAEVEQVAKHANARVRSAGVALGACSLPQTLKPNFEIGDDEMEIGMGIHGEAGIFRAPVETADAVSDRLMELLFAELELSEGDEVAVLVNGLGATSLMELYIVHRRVRERLDAIGVSLHNSWVGNYVTSLEMAGASISILKLDSELKRYLDHPCVTPALQVGQVTEKSVETVYATKQPTAVASIDTGNVKQKELASDGDITPDMFKRMLVFTTGRIYENRDYLCELDAAIGDGDHGVTMDIGWRAICDAVSELSDKVTISDICECAGNAFLNAVGASAGPLYATAFLRASDAVSDRLNLGALSLVSLISAMKNGIEDRGGAHLGDKTMLDAWIPAAKAAGQAQKTGMTALECMVAASKAAETGMNSTLDLRSKRGRSAKLGARSVGHIDPGAASAFIIISAMADFFAIEMS
ncbi:MAG: dihydroxyacetone kinase subunit DhaL [Hyphomicrobiales bacterium]